MPAGHFSQPSSPTRADRAREAEAAAGELLLCNVMVEQASAGVTRAGFVEPITALAQIDNPAGALVAKDHFGQLHQAGAGLRSASP